MSKKYSKDPLGSRIKDNYENRTRVLLPRRAYTIMRLDGKSFHSFTRGMKRPYDEQLMAAMDYTATELCKQIQGAKFAFVQSDEIQILITDFEEITTDAWFNGNVQKMVSISAAIATSYFNRYMSDNLITNKLAQFDSRVFTVPDPTEVYNTFVWRQQDATRNSITMMAQSLFSHKELHGKNQTTMQDMIHSKGRNWNDCPVGFKRGRLILKFEANGWLVVDPPVFTKDPQYLRNLIPEYK